MNEWMNVWMNVWMNEWNEMKWNEMNGMNEMKWKQRCDHKWMHININHFNLGTYDNCSICKFN